jgi:hypothetical protein
MMNAITLNFLLHSLHSQSLPRDFSDRYFKMDAACSEGLWWDKMMIVAHRILIGFAQGRHPAAR